MSRDNYISSDDYDIYEIPLDRYSFFDCGRKTEQKVRSSLEKLHPCFTEQCAFDFYVMHRKSGTYAVAVVMDAVQLAEYRSSGKNNYICVREFGDRKLFVPESTKKFRKIFCYSLFALCIAVSLFFHVRWRITENSQKQVVVRPVPVQIKQDRRDVTYVLSNVLGVFYEPESDVSYFEYSEDKKPQITIRTSGLQRERIENTVNEISSGMPMTFSATSYRDRTPYLTVVFACDSQELKTASFLDVPSSVAEIRNAVISADGLPVSEDCELRQYQCVIPYISFERFLDMLENVQAEMNVKIQKISFDYIREIGSFNCTLVLDKMKGETIVPLKKLAAMFKAPPVPAQKETVKKPPVVVPEVPVAIEEPEIEVQEEGVDTVQEVPEIIIDPSWVLIGKMPSPDGRIVFYYRTREGKIVYEWE